jgi:hypothetical protein
MGTSCILRRLRHPARFWAFSPLGPFPRRARSPAGFWTLSGEIPKQVLHRAQDGVFAATTATSRHRREGCPPLVAFVNGSRGQSSPLTNAISKKVEHHAAAIALYFM